MLRRISPGSFRAKLSEREPRLRGARMCAPSEAALVATLFQLVSVIFHPLQLCRSRHAVKPLSNLRRQVHRETCFIVAFRGNKSMSNSCKRVHRGGNAAPSEAARQHIPSGRESCTSRSRFAFFKGYLYFQFDFSRKRSIFIESNISGRSSVWLER